MLYLIRYIIVSNLGNSMKNRIIIISVLVLISSFANAQECGEEIDEFGELEECKDNIVNFRIDTFGFLAKSISGGIDYGITDNFSVGIDLGYIYETDLIEGIAGESKSAALRFSIYSDSNLTDSLISLAGWRVSNITLNDTNISENSLTTTGFVRSGFRWLWVDSGLNLLMNAGITYTRVDSDYLKNAVRPEVEISFGYQF